MQSGLYLCTDNKFKEGEEDQENTKQGLSLQKLEDDKSFLFRLIKDAKTSEENECVKHQNLIYLESVS